MTEKWEALLTILMSQLERHGMRILLAVVIAAVGWIAAGWASRAVRKLCDRAPRMDKTLTPMLVRLTRWSVLAITLVAILEKLGIETTSIIAFLGAAGLAVGLALKDSVGDIASGVLLMVLRPFNVGEAVNIGGSGGVVDAIDLFETKITTFEGVPTVIPNSKVRSSNIENYTRAVKRRFDIVVGIAYEDEIAKALAILQDIISKETRILPDPEPLLNVMELGDSSVNILLRVWTKPGDFFATKLDLTRIIKERLDSDQITIPYPQRVVHLLNEKRG